MSWQTTVLVLLGLAAVSAEEPATALKNGVVRGKVDLRLKGVRIKDIAPVVVYLDALEGKLPYKVPKKVPRITQKDARFSPTFLVVTAGQTVEFPNDDLIAHNVFSYSKRNEFDLGLYPKGETKFVKFTYPGSVRVYCSIHESMSVTIFVAPLSYHDQVDTLGAFEISGVPPGKYWLKTWPNFLPEVKQKIEIVEDKVTNVEIMILEQGLKKIR